MTLIQVEGVSFSYPNGFEAVKDVSFAVEPGDNIAIIGQNGAGKTTTVKLLNGLLKPTAGKVYVKGKDTKDFSTAEISRTVAYVFQNPDDQIFNNSVYNELVYALKKMKYEEEEIERRVDYAAALAGISELLYENPYDLPLSIRKLVTIASVIATDAEVFIFDEPTAGQDIQGLKVLSGIIDALIEKGKAVITITHDMEYVVDNFEKIIVMANKKIRAVGNPSEVFFDEVIMDMAMLNPPAIVSIFQRMGLNEKSTSVDELAEIIKANSKNITTV